MAVVTDPDSGLAFCRACAEGSEHLAVASEQLQKTDLRFPHGPLSTLESSGRPWPCSSSGAGEQGRF